MPPVANDLFTHIGEIIAAVAALGIAAQGLVDVTRGLWINLDRSGFIFISRTLKPFDKALSEAMGNSKTWRNALWAHWINRRDAGEQKSIAKSLIRLGLKPENAADIAKGIAIDPVAFAGVVDSITKGITLTPEQIDLLGRFDASVDARLDAAFERAERRYQSVAKNFAALYSVILALCAGYLLSLPKGSAVSGSISASTLDEYLFTPNFFRDLMVGIVAVPLAPVSKDLTASLKAAADALKSFKRP